MSPVVRTVLDPASSGRRRVIFLHFASVPPDKWSGGPSNSEASSFLWFLQSMLRRVPRTVNQALLEGLCLFAGLHGHQRQDDRIEKMMEVAEPWEHVVAANADCLSTKQRRWSPRRTRLVLSGDCVDTKFSWGTTKCCPQRDWELSPAADFFRASFVDFFM